MLDQWVIFLTSTLFLFIIVIKADAINNIVFDSIHEGCFIETFAYNSKTCIDVMYITGVLKDNELYNCIRFGKWEGEKYHYIPESITYDELKTFSYKKVNNAEDIEKYKKLMFRCKLEDMNG